MDDVGMSEDLDADAGGSVHFRLKKFFIDGTPLFMSLVAMALVLGLAFCIERITYLTLSEINAKRLMKDIDAKVAEGDVEGAKQLCRETRGPVASICYQGLMHINEKMAIAMARCRRPSWRKARRGLSCSSLWHRR